MQISSRQCLLPTWPVAAQHQLYPHFQHISSEPHTTPLCCSAKFWQAFTSERSPPSVITGRSDDRGYLTCRVWSDLNQMCSDKHISEFKAKTDPKNGVWFLRLISTQTPGRTTLKMTHVHHCLFKSHYTKLLYLFIIYNTSLIAFFFFWNSQVASLEIHQIYAFTTCFCKLLD